MADLPLPRPALAAARPRRFGRIVAFGASAAVLAMPLWPARAPVKTQMGLAVQDAAHVVLGLLLTFTLWFALRRGPVRRRDAALAFAGAVALLSGVELLQGIFRLGDASWTDVGYDLAGALVALAVLAAPTLGRRGVVLAAVIAAIAISIPAHRLGSVALAQQLRAQMFPQLGRFEDSGELIAWSGRGGCSVRLVQHHATEGRGALLCVFGRTLRPSLVLWQPGSDWSAYDDLLVDVYNDSGRPLDLCVKVTDGVAWKRRRERFEIALPIPPGASTISLPITTIAAGPANRRLDLKRVQSLSLFMRRPGAPARLYVDNVRLTTRDISPVRLAGPTRREGGA
ncbi:MAG: hypothetical protein KBD01_03805 [Acidobacteria bacterium]|nr:hypothetical protein [Acidobacteriota bacterium]